MRSEPNRVGLLCLSFADGEHGSPAAECGRTKNAVSKALRGAKVFFFVFFFFQRRVRDVFPTIWQ